MRKLLNLEKQSQAQTGNELSELNQLIPEFVINRDQEKLHKETKDKLGNEIKEIMKSQNIQTYAANGLRANCSVYDKESFNEEILLQIIKEEKLEKLIKTKEYVDIDLLKDALYKGELDPIKLARSQEVVKMTRLTVTKDKGEKNGND